MQTARPEPSDEALFAVYAGRGDREALGELVSRHLALAYALARSVLASPEDAEDAVQNATVQVMRKARLFREGSRVRPWLMAVVLNEARNLARGRAANAAREAAAGRLRPAGYADPAEAAAGAELGSRLLAALDTLDEDARLPILLHHVHGLPQSEVAEVLDASPPTVGRRIKEGLARMRKMLAAAGLSALVPTLEVSLAGADAHAGAPARLAAAVISKIAEAKGSAAASAAVKGGLAMKLIAGAVLTAAVAAGAAMTLSKGGDSAPVAAETPKKFDAPVWHPDARWERAGDWAGTWISSNLDGPRKEVMWRSNFGSFEKPVLFDPQGGPYGLRGYDAKTDRIHMIAGSGRGFMDGPFSRARWGGQGYVNYPSRALSPDERFQVRTDPFNGGAVRILDRKEQMIRTALPPGSGAQAMVIDSKGNVLVLLKGGRLVTIDPVAAKTVGEITLKATEGLSLGFGRGLALDEKKGRLYASGTVVKNGNWHVWYFDLNDGGSFHGVLAGGKTGPSPGYAGPFDTYKGYAEQSICFGPDDPEKRFLYLRCTDTGTFMRLDLEKEIVAACSGPPRNKTGPVMFIESGTPNGTVSHCGPVWLPGGDFIMPGLREGPAPHFRRVK